jgi:hypothetical protein
MGFVGVDIVGRRGEPSMLLTKLENAPFFFAPPERRFFARPSPLPSLYRLAFGLAVAGGVVSILALKERDCRRYREGWSVCECGGPAGLRGAPLLEALSASSTIEPNVCPTEAEGRYATVGGSCDEGWSTCACFCCSWTGVSDGLRRSDEAAVEVPRLG